MSTPKKAAPPVKATYVKPTVELKVKALRGKAPAVVLLPDTGGGAAASTEAKSLAALGIGSLVVESSAKPPANASAFDIAIDQVLAAVKRLREQPGVDRDRIGIVAEGVGAHVGAVAIGREPDAVTAAVLADIGGVVVPSPEFAPERWLGKADGIQLLFQRDEAKRAMTSEEVKRLILASPPGTLMEQYKDLGATAQKSRDTWIRGKLLAG